MKLKFLIFVLPALPFFFFCASSQNGSRQTVKTGDHQKIIEDFDPGTLGDYRQDEREENESAQVFDIDKFLQGTAMQELGGATQVPGYRIQLVSTRDESEARIIKQEALLKFDVEVYTIFDNPYYKVRVGNCISRLEAEALQQKAIEEDFLDAWVVKTMVVPVTEEESHD